MKLDNALSVTANTLVEIYNANNDLVDSQAADIVTFSGLINDFVVTDGADLSISRFSRKEMRVTLSGEDSLQGRLGAGYSVVATVLE